MSDNKVVPYHKNKYRDQDDEDLESHMPQHQSLGIEPEKVNSAPITGNFKVAKSMGLPSDNSRNRRDAIRPLPYATPGPHKTTKMPILNVGNNNEHAWTGDFNFLDDVSELDASSPMIDNNDFVSEAAFELPSSSMLDKNINFSTKIEDHILADDRNTEPSPPLDNSVSSNNTLSLLNSMQDNLFLLFVAGVPICSGPLKEIEEQAYLLFVGEHPVSLGAPVPLEEIMVIKKVGLKVGLFLDRE